MTKTRPPGYRNGKSALQLQAKAAELSLPPTKPPKTKPGHKKAITPTKSPCTMQQETGITEEKSWYAEDDHCRTHREATEKSPSTQSTPAKALQTPIQGKGKVCGQYLGKALQAVSLAKASMESSGENACIGALDCSEEQQTKDQNSTPEAGMKETHCENLEEITEDIMDNNTRNEREEEYAGTFSKRREKEHSAVSAFLSGKTPLILAGVLLLAGGAYVVFQSNLGRGGGQPFPRSAYLEEPQKARLERYRAHASEDGRFEEERYQREYAQRRRAHADEVTDQRAFESTANYPEERAFAPKRPAFEHGLRSDADSFSHQDRDVPRAEGRNGHGVEGVGFSAHNKADPRFTALEASDTAMTAKTKDANMLEMSKAILELENRLEGLEQETKKMAASLEALQGKRTLSTNALEGQAEKAKEGAAEKEKKPLQAKSGKTIDQWSIVGFSGSRVVISDPNGNHFVSIGQKLGGVTILGIDVETGTIKTSEGPLRYK